MRQMPLMTRIVQTTQSVLFLPASLMSGIAIQMRLL